jgi:hypothetical protein
MKKVMYTFAAVAMVSMVAVMMMTPGCSNSTSETSSDSTAVDTAALVDSTSLTGDSTTAKIDTGVAVK